MIQTGLCNHRSPQSREKTEEQEGDRRRTRHSRRMQPTTAGLEGARSQGTQRPLEAEKDPPTARRETGTWVLQPVSRTRLPSQNARTCPHLDSGPRAPEQGTTEPTTPLTHKGRVTIDTCHLARQVRGPPFQQPQKRHTRIPPFIPPGDQGCQSWCYPPTTGGPGSGAGHAGLPDTKGPLPTPARPWVTPRRPPGKRDVRTSKVNPRFKRRAQTTQEDRWRRPPRCPTCGAQKATCRAGLSPATRPLVSKSGTSKVRPELGHSLRVPVLGTKN